MTPKTEASKPLSSKIKPPVAFRQQLTDPVGAPLLATFSIVPRIEVVELIAYGGFDAVILDLEHGPYSIEALPALILAAQSAGIASLVRVPDARHQVIGAVLDLGADGVVVPNVRSAENAAEAVAAARFSPDGTRGANPYVRAGRYSSNETYFTDANGRAAMIAMIEGREGLASIDAILDVEGLDAILLGPVDISMALGVPGNTDHPLVVSAISAAIKRAKARAVAVGVFAPQQDMAVRWIRLGARFVALSVDTAMILHSFREAAQAVRRNIADAPRAS